MAAYHNKLPKITEYEIYECSSECHNYLDVFILSRPRAKLSQLPFSIIKTKKQSYILHLAIIHIKSLSISLESLYPDLLALSLFLLSSDTKLGSQLDMPQLDTPPACPSSIKSMPSEKKSTKIKWCAKLQTNKTFQNEWRENLRRG